MIHSVGTVCLPLKGALKPSAAIMKVEDSQSLQQTFKVMVDMAPVKHSGECMLAAVERLRLGTVTKMVSTSKEDHCMGYEIETVPELT